MTLSATSVRVLLSINHQQVDWDDLTPRELEAILREIRMRWAPDMQSRLWFSAEKQGRFVGGRWETAVYVICYHIPDKSQRSEIPQIYINQLVGKTFIISPIVEAEEDENNRRSANFRRLESQRVDVLFVLE